MIALPVTIQYTKTVEDSLESKFSTRDTAKPKHQSQLPKVLLQDNIGLQNDLQKTINQLKTEHKKTLNHWTHCQKVFITRQLMKERQSGLTLVPFIHPGKSKKTISLTVDKHQKLPPIAGQSNSQVYIKSTENKTSTTRPFSFPRVTVDRNVRGCKFGKSKEPVVDPRFLKLQESLERVAILPHIKLDIL